VELKQRKVIGSCKFKIYFLQIQKIIQTVLPKLFKGMDYFSEISQGKVKTKTLLYGGNDSHDRTNYRVRDWKGGVMGVGVMDAGMEA
jgi:hypothetical protein